jgi:hypothetical protein
VALAVFGLDSLIEIGASTVVLWELSGTGEDRQRRALRLIGGAFVALAAYLAIQSAVVLAAGYRPGHSVLGIAWTAVTAAVMFALAAGKARTGRQLGNPVLATEGRVTLVDGILAVAVLAGLALNAGAGVWWADPLAALVIVFYALREARTIFRPATGGLRHRPGSHLGFMAPAERYGVARPGRPFGTAVLTKNLDPVHRWELLQRRRNPWLAPVLPAPPASGHPVPSWMALMSSSSTAMTR